MNQVDLEEIAKHAAHEAIRETFRLLGVDIADQDSLNAFRADLIHAHTMRKIYEESGSMARRIIITTGGGALLIAVWEGIKHALKL